MEDTIRRACRATMAAIILGAWTMVGAELAAGSERPPRPRIDLVGDPILIAEEGPYNSNTDVVLLRSGDLLIVYNTGMSHAAADMKIQLRRSVDQGQTWGEPRTIVPPINKGAGVRDPHIIQLADGRLLVSYFSHPRCPRLQGIQTWVMASTDDGKTWDAPVLVGSPGPQGSPGDWTATSGKIVQLDDKVLLLPVYGDLECGVMRSTTAPRVGRGLCRLSGARAMRGSKRRLCGLTARNWSA